jgi:HSP20 family protein
MELMNPLIPWTRRRTPRPLATMRDDLDRLIDWALEPGPFMPPRLRVEGELLFMPVMDVHETADELVIKAEMPGLEDKDIEVELTKDRLILKGEKHVEREEKEEGYFCAERQFGVFHRELRLPWEVDADKVSADAKLANGVLTVTVPRPKEAVPGKRRIAIHA